MKTTIVPCNSLATFEHELSTASDSPSPLLGFTPPRRSKRVRFSEPDLKIIQDAMSIERKKTLMCTEQSKFQVLQHLILPEKKFGAACPTEYQKFMIKNLKIKTRTQEDIRYEYPSDKFTDKKVRRKGNSVMCSLF